VRTAAVSALGDLKTPKARQALLELLKGKKSEAGRAAEGQGGYGR
jgi:HEAT repeat protein